MCFTGGGLHHGAYLFSTTIGSVELETYDPTKVSDLGLIGQCMQDAEYNLRRIHLPRTRVNRAKRKARLPRRG